MKIPCRKRVLREISQEELERAVDMIIGAGKEILVVKNITPFTEADEEGNYYADWLIIFK